jgi:hypothetical protein
VKSLGRKGEKRKKSMIHKLYSPYYYWVLKIEVGSYIN